MAMNGVVADEQFFSDRLVGETGGDEPQNLELARGQAAVVARTRRSWGRGRRLRQPLEQQTGARDLELGLQLREDLNGPPCFKGRVIDAIERRERTRQLNSRACDFVRRVALHEPI